MERQKDEDRVDGRELEPLREPGSDARLSHEAQARITRRRLEGDGADVLIEDYED